MRRGKGRAETVRGIGRTIGRTIGHAETVRATGRTIGHAMGRPPFRTRAPRLSR
jgi:hypothetical protein